MELNFKSLLSDSFKFFRHHFRFLAFLYILAIMVLLLSFVVSVIPPIVAGGAFLSPQFGQLGAILEQLDQTETNPELFIQMLAVLQSILLNPIFLFSFMVFLLAVSYFSVAQALVLLEGIKGAAAGEPRMGASLWTGIKKGWQGLWIASLILGIYLVIFLLLMIALVPLGFWFLMTTGSGLVSILPAALAFLLMMTGLAASIYFSVIFSLSFQSYIFEDHKGWAALKRSMELTRSHRWRVLGYFAGLTLLFLVAWIPLELAAELFRESREPVFMLLYFVLSAMDFTFQLLASIFFPVFSVQLYWKLKMASNPSQSSQE